MQVTIGKTWLNTLSVDNIMEWAWLINLLFTVVCWRFADDYETGSFGWTLLMFGSASNGAVVMTNIL